MNFKKINTENNTITRDMAQFNVMGNVYKAVAVMGKRANQISAEMKQEIVEKLEDFSGALTSEEVTDNKERTEISRYYERLPKPSSIALQEFLDNKIYVRDISVPAAPTATAPAAE